MTSSIALVIGEANCRELGTASCARASSGCKACVDVVVVVVVSAWQSWGVSRLPCTGRALMC